MRGLAVLEMEPLSLKGKQVDLGGIFCVTNYCLVTVIEGGIFAKGSGVPVCTLLSSFLLPLLSNVQEMSEVRGAF